MSQMKTEFGSEERKRRGGGVGMGAGAREASGGGVQHEGSDGVTRVERVSHHGHGALLGCSATIRASWGDSGNGVHSGVRATIPRD